jgi:YD repeat-containing protein
VELADGRRIFFTAVDSGLHFRPSAIFDRFGNWVNVTYPTVAGYAEVWDVTDSQGRAQRLYFTNAVGTTYPQQLLDRIELGTFGGVTATWKFHYGYRYIARGPEDQSNLGNIRVALLTEITMPDDTGAANGPKKYSFITPGQSGSDPDPYYNTTGVSSGTVRGMQLPTGGWLEWDFTDLQFPQDPDDHFKYPNHTVGAQTRRQLDRDRTPLGSWGYLFRYGCGGQPCQTPYWYVSCSQEAPRQLVTMMTAPDQTTTVHYYSIFVGDGGEGFFCVSPDWSFQLYGLPTTNFAKNAEGRPLSWEVRTGVDLSNPGAYNLGPISSGTVIRSGYAYYHYDLAASAEVAWDANRREQYAATYFNDDAHCGTNGTAVCYTSINRFGWNDFGHFRQESQGGNFPGKYRTTFTNYDGTLDANKDWVLGTYTEWCAAEEETPRAAAINSCADLPNAVTAKFQFNRATGFLQAARTLVGSALGKRDLLATFTPDSRGNVQYERYYGGDAPEQAQSESLPFTPITTPRYEIQHAFTYASTNGPLTSRQTHHAGLTFFDIDENYDAPTGSVSTTRDVAGVSTGYTYDTLGRLKTVKPAGAAWSLYSYNDANATTPASVTAKKCPKSDTANCAAPLMEQRYYYDGLGRLILSKTRMSDSGQIQWSTVKSEYDAMGRLAKTSTPENRTTADFEATFAPSSKTQTDFDVFSRPVKITNPDTSSFDFVYTGVRQKIRTSKIWTGGTAERPFDVTEQYDGLGRLAKVKEKSGSTTSVSSEGSLVETVYGYDAADHLTSVRMADTSGGPVQYRLFDFDGRGFLRWQSQPESGITSFEYDARGHIMSKTQSAANSLFDLKLTYDGAERLTLLEGRNPFYDPVNPTAAQPQFRPIKQFEFGTANVPAPNNKTDWRLGKLLRATRHNYPETNNVFNMESEIEISDLFAYIDDAGRKTSRTTSVTEITGGVGGTRWPVRDLTMSLEYNDLDLPSTIKYPTCTDCGLPPTDPDRSGVTRTYAAGRLKSLSGYISDISYWPNGMRNVLVHTNGIADTQTVTNMPRPSQISFGIYDRCVRPSFVTQPVSGEVPSSGSAFNLSVTVNGTGPFTYAWYKSSNYAVVGTDPSITVYPTATTTYYVDVTGACGHEQSQLAKVTIAECATPSTGWIHAVLQPDGSWILKPNPVARAGRTFNWTRPPNPASLGTTETLAVSALSTTTTYRLTVTDTCGSASGDVTITVPLPITSGLEAHAVSGTQISVSWPAVAGATQYTVQRRSGATWETVGTTNSPGFNDTVASSRTYAYHVTTDNGGSTNYDVATTMSFTPASIGQTITPVAVNDMLNAVNKVREAAGWPALTWSNVLAATDPVPAPGSLIFARHVMSCRARMNEALQALGVQIQNYPNPDLTGGFVHAADINEVQQRTQ